MLSANFPSEVCLKSRCREHTTLVRTTLYMNSYGSATYFQIYTYDMNTYMQFVDATNNRKGGLKRATLHCSYSYPGRIEELKKKAKKKAIKQSAKDGRKQQRQSK